MKTIQTSNSLIDLILENPILNLKCQFKCQNQSVTYLSIDKFNFITELKILPEVNYIIEITDTDIFIESFYH